MKESRAQKGDNVNVFALLLSKEGEEEEEKKRYTPQRKPNRS